MVFNTKFSLPSFLKQVKKLTENQKESIKRAGFGNLLRIPDHVLRRSQLIQLMEKWSCEKQAFVFPPGEIQITLLDVSLILGLRVVGRPVVLKLLAPLSSLEKEFGASISNRTISVDLLKEKLESVGERDDESFIQTFMLYCFGTLLFPSANGKVDSRYLYFLQDVDSVSSFAWGAAVLEDLIKCLSQRKSKNTTNIGGCLILLQIWCYEHIIIGRPKLLDHPSTFPRVCRWESSARHYLMSSQFNINFEELEHTQILWKLEPTSEEMEIDMIREIPQEWHLSSGPGTIEQPIEVDCQSAIRMVTVHSDEVEEEEEEEEPTSPEDSTIFVISDEWHLRRGPGTIEQPIEVQSQSAIRRVRKHSEEEVDEDEEEAAAAEEEEEEEEEEEDGEEEEPMSREKSAIFVVSDDEDSKGIEDLKKEILELKMIIEERKEKEAKKRAEDEDEIKILRSRVQNEEELRTRHQHEIEELKKRVRDEEEVRKRLEAENERLCGENVLMDRCISDLGRLLSNDSVDL